LDKRKIKLFIIVSEDWSFWSHRLSLALAAKQNGYDVTLITKVNDLAGEIKSRGINVININFTRSSRFPITDLVNVYKLIKILKNEKPDIIHNVALKTILIGTIAALFSRNSVVVNAFTGLGYVFSSNQIQARLIRLIIIPVFKYLLRRDNCWTIFQNSDDMKLFRNLGMIQPEQSVLIRGSGVDTNEFKFTPDTNDIPVVMLASRMLWDKGVGEFVEASKRINQEKIKVKFVLVGDTDDANPMAIPESVLKEWAKDDCITWNGHSNTMPETLSSASIVCLPSYREGLPKVLLEAAAVGRPLIATDVPGCREIVRHNKNGMLVKLQDVESLYEAMKLMIKNKEKRTTMGKASREIVETELSTTIINAQTIELYRTMCG
jgi:glycosyltransferase involved in cell wall biosynthesis